MFALVLTFLLPLATALCIDSTAVRAASSSFVLVTGRTQAECTATCGAAQNPCAYYTHRSCYCARVPIHTEDTVDASCGGCVHGLYATPQSASGENCATAPGVAPNSATCVNGVCRATACIPGWVLRGDDCVYNIYGNVYRGSAAEQARAAGHLGQYAVSDAGHAAETWEERPEWECRGSRGGAAEVPDDQAGRGYAVVACCD
ncbi:hypothetical protein CspeluHIS016_0210900 [Cutaneotrichosporon spelunceum]|uniref:Protein CPL1-like domain-containing protein n=1 Tax=Cutaneotrichosporon spelunceum TaxID=1672016 RepID=A0AAD3YBQ2_9TREE|nr:hypothetical protein CspeluHIS016_0210900 [Cutaneotrichosporon spelunceum]